VKALAYDAWYGALERGRYDLSFAFGERGPTPYQFYRSQMDPALVRPGGERATANYHRFGHEEAASMTVVPLVGDDGQWSLRTDRS
jgi:peptide/nickel transport system substrate-binding protein